MKLSLQFHLWGYNNGAFVTVPPVGHNDEAFVTTYGGTTMGHLLQFHLWRHNNGTIVTVPPVGAQQWNYCYSSTCGGTTMRLLLQFHLRGHNNGAKVNVNCLTLRKASMGMSINCLILKTSTPPLFSPSLMSLMVFVDVKHHIY